MKLIICIASVKGKIGCDPKVEGRARTLAVAIVSRLSSPTAGGQRRRNDLPAEDSLAGRVLALAVTVISPQLLVNSIPRSAL
jgi:hypothetical protein